MDLRDIADCQNEQLTDSSPKSLSNDIQTEDNIQDVISVRSEESITQAASDHIKETLRALKKDEGGGPIITEDEQNKDAQEKAELARRVQVGEITPFQAEASKSMSKKRNFGEAFGLAGLEQYLKRQAELSAQQKKLKGLKSGKHKSNESVERTDIEKKLPPDRSKKITTKEKSVLKKTSLPDEQRIPTEVIDSFCTESKKEDSGSEYAPSDGSIQDFDEEHGEKRPKRRNKKPKSDVSKQQASCSSGEKRIFDDGDDDLYRERMEARLRENPSRDSLHTVDNLFKVPKSIWKKLYEYQKVSVRWLWELHGRSLGGLLGDEMGLGKTVQVIAFLAGLDASELLSDGARFRGLGPTIVVCPATLLEQWVKHFRDWAPSLRVVVLHHSGTYRGDPESLIESVAKTGGIVVTSYSGILQHKDIILESLWHYVILDEGHKIRNPEAKITKAVKRFTTPHRLLLTGSPMQNSLKELWSLFDFILPGKLGCQESFLEHCANPITRGGYANASPLQEATALQVATMLKEAISPYMLRRTKNDVQHHIQLPEKNEQVLFCSLTELQKNLYKEYLRTDHVSSVLHDKSNQSENGYRARLLVALTNLRKICNHPDLYTYGTATAQDVSDEEVDVSEESLENFGHWKHSGKLTVVKSLLKIWKRQGHRVVLFTQSRQMMHILEALAQREEYTYLRLDGTTPMAQRQQTIHRFNNDLSYFVFISTTRVGGLGINLTGANRVVIYDPDWNPAVDAQARERAWRIGQDKRVTIYRLITAGTVEEKIYHRQIFKLLLSNRVLEDPRQRRLFQTSDLRELFNLNEPMDGKTSESDRIFRDCKLEPTPKSSEPQFSPSKIEAMKKLASSVSKKIAEISKKNMNKEEETSLAEGADRSVEKSHRKKSKKRKAHDSEVTAMFEGEKVRCLIGRRLGRSDSSDEHVSSTCDDEYVLRKLFSKTKVSSAFQHDAVLSNARSDGKQSNPMSKMAHDAAQESMDLLRQSRKWCWRPTWDSPKNRESV